MADALKEKLDKAKKSGSLNLSSADVMASVAPANEAPDITAPVTGTVKTEVSASAKNDVVMNEANKGNPGQVINEQSTANIALRDMVAAVPLSEMLVEITDADREAFKDAVIADTRYVYDFTLLGGKLKGKFRSRTQDESMAILAHLNVRVRKGDLVDQLHYSMLLRAGLLAAQVMELNGVRYDELATPLYWTRKDKEEVAPAWIKQAEGWVSRQEALTTILYDALQIFERKYWTMVDNAPDANFWSPAAST